MLNGRVALTGFSMGASLKSYPSVAARCSKIVSEPAFSATFVASRFLFGIEIDGRTAPVSSEI